MNPAFWVLWAIGVSLQIALLHRMVSGRLYRRAPTLFVYVVVLFITGLLDMMLYIDVGGWVPSSAATRAYWFDDTVRQCGLLAVILAFMYRIGANSHRVRLVSIAVAVGFGAAAFVYRMETGDQKWTVLIRNMSFVAVLLNFALWTRLMRESREGGSAPRKQAIPARAAMAFSAGAGVQLAGEAVGHSLRTIAIRRSPVLVDAANYLLVAAHLVCLLVWLTSLRALAEDPEPFPKRADGGAEGRGYGTDQTQPSL